MVIRHFAHAHMILPLISCAISFTRLCSIKQLLARCQVELRVVNLLENVFCNSLLHRCGREIILIDVCWFQLSKHGIVTGRNWTITSDACCGSWCALCSIVDTHTPEDQILKCHSSRWSYPSNTCVQCQRQIMVRA